MTALARTGSTALRQSRDYAERCGVHIIVVPFRLTRLSVLKASGRFTRAHPLCPQTKVS